MDFEKEGSWSISFVGSGFLGLYHVGVTHCLQEHAPRLLQGAHRFYGSSSGALYATCFVCGMSVDYCCLNLLGMIKVIKRLTLGIFHPAFAPIEHIKSVLQKTLPNNAHILASKRLGISLTHWPDGKNVIVTNFATRDELIQAIVCTLYFPVYCGVIPPEFRGERYFDGALSNNVPFKNNGSTITVSPYHGTLAICPQEDIIKSGLPFYNRKFLMGYLALFPPSPETVADICRQGYLDALRFLEMRGLTKEPILWSLTSKAPPSPAEGTHDSGCNQEGKAGLTLNWAVPNVLVKDVPNFEQLSPELEAALRKACMRKSGFWANFWRSGSGQILTYLLLPCTLPVEYVYFRSKRVLVWLPDAPADLRWMLGQLWSLVHVMYSWTKTQLLWAVSLPFSKSLAADPLQPGVDLTANFAQAVAGQSEVSLWARLRRRCPEQRTVS